MMKIPRIKRTAEEIKWNHGNICDEKHTTPRHPKESQTIIGKLCDKKSKSWTSSEKHNHRYDEKHKNHRGQIASWKIQWNLCDEKDQNHRKSSKIIEIREIIINHKMWFKSCKIINIIKTQRKSTNFIWWKGIKIIKINGNHKNSFKKSVWWKYKHLVQTRKSLKIIKKCMCDEKHQNQRQSKKII